MKNQLLFVCLFLSVFTVYSQDVSTAKSLFDKANLAFDNSNFSEVIPLLDQVKENLDGTSNPDIVFLEAKTLFELQTNNDKCQSLFENFLESRAGYDDPREEQAITFISKLIDLGETGSPYADFKKKYIDAFGGIENIQKVKTIKRVYNLSTSGTSIGTYTELIDNNNSYVKIIEQTGGVILIKVVFHEGKGYILDPSGKRREMDDKELKTYKELAVIFPFAKKGLRISSKKETKYNRQDAFELTYDAIDASFYFSKDGILLGEVSNINGVKNEKQYYEYTTKKGVQVESNLSIINNLGKLDLELIELKINPSLRQKDFE